MTDLSRDLIHQQIADGITVAAGPGTVAIWYYLDKVDFLLRLGISAGTFSLICYAVWVRFFKGSK